ncbi:hypothetical protein SAMN04487917_102463 [Arthrobacter sp. yr096]|nr:hypothetical protein SAMN04487917_102463 [Arthrobacter sp. yr096]
MWAPQTGGVCCGARFTPFPLAEARSVGPANGGVFVVGPVLRPFPWLRRAVWAPQTGSVCCGARFTPFPLVEARCVGPACGGVCCGVWCACLGGVLGRTVGPANGGCVLWGLVCVFGWGFGAQSGPRKRGVFVVGPVLRPLPWLRGAEWAPQTCTSRGTQQRRRCPEKGSAAVERSVGSWLLVAADRVDFRRQFV